MSAYACTTLMHALPKDAAVGGVSIILCSSRVLSSVNSYFCESTAFINTCDKFSANWI